MVYLNKVYSIMKTKIFFCLILSIISFHLSLAQSSEPATNIGNSLSYMKHKFPELRYIGTDAKGDKYEDGYPQDGIATFFYFKNNAVIEECMIVQSYDRFARDVFQSWSDEIFIKYPGLCSKSSYNTKNILYSKFRMHIIFVAENGINTSLLIYEKGGWEDGINCNNID